VEVHEGPGSHLKCSNRHMQKRATARRECICASLALPDEE